MNILISTNKDFPQKAHTTDACADLTATSITHDGKYVEYGTNMKMLAPEGFFGLVFPRSSISNYDLVLANSVGVIDEYTGEWKLRFKRLKQPLIDSLYRQATRKQEDFITLSLLLKASTFKFFRFSLKNEIERLRKEVIDLDQQIQDLESFEKIYQVGDKIAQFAFLPKHEWTYTLVDTLPETVRGEGGFGSTTSMPTAVSVKSHNNRKKIQIMDKSKNDFRANILVTVFSDWENQKGIIGTAMLVKRIKKGLPFILKDTQTVKVVKKESFHGTDFFNWTNEEKNLGECNQYNYEKWLCKMIKSTNPAYQVNELYTFNLRYLEGSFEDSQIFSNSKDDEDDDENAYREQWKNKNLIDEFVKVDGEEIY